jgi:hypothetical protein
MFPEGRRVVHATGTRVRNRTSRSGVRERGRGAREPPEERPRTPRATGSSRERLEGRISPPRRVTGCGSRSVRRVDRPRRRRVPRG